MKIPCARVVFVGVGPAPAQLQQYCLKSLFTAEEPRIEWFNTDEQDVDAVVVPLGSTIIAVDQAEGQSLLNEAPHLECSRAQLVDALKEPTLTRCLYRLGTVIAMNLPLTPDTCAAATISTAATCPA